MHQDHHAILQQPIHVHVWSKTDNKKQSRSISNSHIVCSSCSRVSLEFHNGSTMDSIGQQEWLPIKSLCRYWFCNMVLFGGKMTSESMTSCRDCKGQLEERKMKSADASQRQKIFSRESCSFSIYVGGERKARREKKRKKQKINDWLRAWFDICI